MTDDSSGDASSSRQEQFDPILADLMRAIDSGESVQPERWLARHPEFTTELREFFAKNERVEKLVRPLRQAAANVLHVRCPHCHNPIELLDQVPLSDISCPSCGSSFSLVGDKTMSHDPTTKSFGQFKLLERVGIGQFGSVWKARDTKLDRTVAIKIPRNGRMDSTQTAMFLRDARAAAQLKHPNIVSVHEVGAQDNTVYIVSDFVQGATLKEWTAAKRLTPREAAELCIKIAQALNHAHEAGVIHRDLKPGNIMMDTEGEPHIVDFGLAKREAGEITMTVEGQILGTPAYMSPEQARGEGHIVDGRADIYSLGVILFELLTGELPFRGEKRMLLVQILNDDPPSPRRLDGAISRDLETICIKCLEKDRHRRYPTAAELSNDLECWANGKPIAARRSGPIEKTWKWARRKPAIAGMIGVSCTAALLLIVALVVSNLLITDALSDRTTALGRARTEELKTRKALGREREALNEKSRALNQRNQAFADMEGSLQREQQINYYRAIDLAWREWRAGHLVEAQTLLKSCRDDLRSWEWHYLMRLCHPVESLRVFNNLEAAPLVETFLSPGGIQISGDGRFLAVVAAPHRIMVVDARSGEDLFTVEHPTLSIRCVAISSDGKLLAGSSRHGCCVWDTESREIIKEGPGLFIESTAEQATDMTRLRFSPDAKRLIGTHDRYARVHRSNESHASKVATAIMVVDVDSGHRLYYVARGACSPDGRFGASYSRGDVLLREIDSAGSSRHLTGLKDRVANVVFSPDGTRLAAVDMYSTVMVWDTATGERINSWTVKPSEFDRFLFAPDGNTLAVLTVESTVQLWDVNAGRQIALFREEEIERAQIFQYGGPAVHRFIAFSPNGNLLASASGDRKLTAWDVKTRRHSAYRSASPILSAMFDPTDKHRMIYLVQHPKDGDAPDGESAFELNEWTSLSRHESRVIHKPGANYHTVAISPDGRRIASLVKAHSTIRPPQLIRIWDSATGEEEQTIEFPREAFDVTFSPDGSQIVVTGYGPAVVFELASGETRHTIDLGGRVLRATYNDAGTRLLLAHHKCTIWNLESKQQMVSFGSDCVCAVYNDDESLVATCGSRGVVSIWNAQTGELVGQMSQPSSQNVADDSRVRGGSYPKYLFTVAFNHDSTRIAACGKSGRVAVWDVSTGKLLLDFLAHEGQAYTVAFGPDGRRLLSMGDDLVLRVWDSANGQEILTLHGHAARIYHATFDREGARIISTSADGTIRIWDGTPLNTTRSHEKPSVTKSTKIS